MDLTWKQTSKCIRAGLASIGTIRDALDAAVAAAPKKIRQDLTDVLGSADPDAEIGAHILAHQQLFEDAPPPSEVQAYWIGLVELVDGKGGDPRLCYYIAGSEEFDPDDDDCDWACGPIWPDPFLYGEIEALRPIYDAREQAGEALEIFATVAAGKLGALILENVSAAALSDLSRPCAAGFDEGTGFTFGEITPDGWLTYSAKRKPKPSPYRLDPDAPEFDPDAYVAAGLDINATDDSGDTVLMRQQHSEVDQILGVIRHGADVNAIDRLGHPVVCRFLGCEPEILEAFIAAGLDLARANEAVDLAMWAVAGPVRNLKILSEHGIFPKFKTDKGENALHLAAFANSRNVDANREMTEMISYLCKHGVDVNAADKYGHTPIWVPIKQHLIEVNKLKGWRNGKFKPIRGIKYFYDWHKTAIKLLEHGADPNTRYASGDQHFPTGSTPLMTSRYDTPDLHKALLDHGADPHIKNKDGKTALDYAQAAAQSKRYDREGAAQVAGLIRRALR